MQVSQDRDGASFALGAAAQALDVESVIFVVPWKKLRRWMSRPQRSRSRIADSVEQAGPMLQMILAGTGAEWFGVGISSE